jgi:hypothetical protein
LKKVKQREMGASLDGLVDELRDAARELDAAVWRAGLSGHFTSTYRSRSEQTRLYRAFQSGRSAFPVAPPGFSAHEYGEAFDYVVSPAQFQDNVGQTWVSWGGEWGGSYDRVHFELPGASGRANERGRAEQDQPGFLGSIIDVGVGLFPVFGEITTVAGILTLFPGLSENEALKMLASPTYYYHQIKRLRS